MRICGIDPGLSGGAFTYDTESHEFQAYRLQSKDGKLDCVDLQRWLIINRVEHVYLEQIFLNGVEGGRSALTIGSNYGRIASACDFAQIPYTEVMPRVWQRALGLKGGSRALVKDEAKTLATDRFTMLPFLTKNKKLHDGLTDAACICIYGVQVWTESQSTESMQSSAQSTEMPTKRSSTSRNKKASSLKPLKGKGTKSSKPMPKRDLSLSAKRSKSKPVGKN